MRDSKLHWGGALCQSVSSVLFDSWQPHRLWPVRLLCLWDSPGKNTAVGCHFLLQGIFLTQGLNLQVLHWQIDSLPLSHLGSRGGPGWGRLHLSCSQLFRLYCARNNCHRSMYNLVDLWMNAIPTDEAVKTTDTTERRPYFKVICLSKSEKKKNNNKKPEALWKMIHSIS